MRIFSTRERERKRESEGVSAREREREKWREMEVGECELGEWGALEMEGEKEVVERKRGEVNG